MRRSLRWDLQDGVNPPKAPGMALLFGGNQPGFGITFVEVLVVAGLLGLVLYLGFSGFFNAGRSATRLAEGYNLHFKLRQTTDKLLERVFEGTEVVQPLPGSTLPFLVIKDLMNNLTLIYCEKAPAKTPGPLRIVKFTDTLKGQPLPEDREVLFDGVKEIRFTTQTPGLVLAHLTLVDSNGRELSGTIEVPMMNIGSIDQ